MIDIFDCENAQHEIDRSTTNPMWLYSRMVAVVIAALEDIFCVPLRIKMQTISSYISKLKELHYTHSKKQYISCNEWKVTYTILLYGSDLLDPSTFFSYYVRFKTVTTQFLTIMCLQLVAHGDYSVVCELLQVVKYLKLWFHIIGLMQCFGYSVSHIVAWLVSKIQHIVAIYI